ncbi:MAG: hypothetical protein CMO80_09350 [Verrucomicrobiales bacterium]|nr:hypothetical protein [Verrucomicrobiales bacterium]|tara:strand:- start:593 stop:1426 length:834 start_codon:yes stop_codon:yes gene_type:complete
MKVVVLTNGHSMSNALFENLARKNVQVDALVYQSPFPPYPSRGGLLEKIRWCAAYPLRLARIPRRHREIQERYRRFDTPTVVTGMLNSSRMAEDLVELHPDYLILAGLGILSPEILSIPVKGTINCHPGLLPWLRNVGVVGHALLRGYPVGVTAHYVNAGIDKGAIIERRLLPVKNTVTLAELKQDVYQLAASMLADLVTAIRRGETPRSFEQRDHFPPCKWLTPEERARADQMATSGFTARCADEWREFVADESKLRLRDEFDGFPVAYEAVNLDG